MRTFLGKCYVLGCLIVLGNYAFAKAQQSSTATTTSLSIEQPLKITAATSRTQLFEAIERLENDHGIKASLTNYSKDGDLIIHLGLRILDKTGVTRRWEQMANDGIPDLCIYVSGDNKLESLVNCNEVVTSAIANIKKEEAVVEMPAIAAPISTTATISRMAGNENSTQKNTDLSKTARATVKEAIAPDVQRIDQAIDRKKQQLDGLKKLQDQKLEESQQIKEQNIDARESLRELEKENKRQIAQRNKLKFNNAKEKQRRDSLAAQQARLEKKLLMQQQSLEESRIRQAQLQKELERQEQLIREQGLKNETAQGLKAYRTAINGTTGDEELLRQGYLVFAGEQCLYKVYDGYTIVYDNLGKLLFTINKELGSDYLEGTLRMQRGSFNYQYNDNVLILRDKDGNTVNEQGVPIKNEALFEAGQNLNTETFTITQSSSVRDLQQLQLQVQDTGADFKILEQVRNGMGEITSIKVSLDNNEMKFMQQMGALKIKIIVNNVLSTTKIEQL
ncbi:hypothetical protein [Nonlabens ponticola]|uniref:Uncharacterized protein n=1 Tax=Nonlabens ponticola TaxID=2496866 RepID=A0A3S9MXG4_9FLAO|nr:hypothetical protein [Nonlabens ponticola]AZQ43931.1 hypothetical protein EJ995_06680 [Nonlabens ponticola]